MTNTDPILSELKEKQYGTFTIVYRSFSRVERLALFWLLAFAIGMLLVSLVMWSQRFIVEVPTRGGMLTEGIIGAPQRINPVSAVSDADRDLSALVYSGLMRITEEGDLVPDLARSVAIAADGLTYTFTLRKNATFHDGTQVTAEDVVYTVSRVKDPTIQSPRRASWEGVNAEAVDAETVVFQLERPYAPFLENTTLGILPKHIWKDVSSELFGFSRFNMEPVGSGPYEMHSIKQGRSGVPDYYDLVPFDNFVHGAPYIKHLRIKFYPNETELIEAFQKGETDAINAIATEMAHSLEEDGAYIERTPLPRVFALFFNQNQAMIFADKGVRKALRAAVDKDLVINEVLHGFGTVIDSPIPPGSIGYQELEANEQALIVANEMTVTANELNSEEDVEVATTTPVAPKDEFIEEARDILTLHGWVWSDEERMWSKKDKSGTSLLAFSISTSDSPELKRVAELLRQRWVKLGADVELKVFESGDLEQNVIRSRKYDSLLFGEVVGRDADPFAFWHSSQRLDPGLNVALYANITADKLLEDARITLDKDERITLYQNLVSEIQSDIPAIFLYAPDFIHITHEPVKGLSLGSVVVPSDRFMNVHLWYVETDRVWSLFTH